VLGFVPEHSLVLATVEAGAIGCVMRVDLSPVLVAGTHQLAEVTAASDPDGVIAVIVDEDGADCDACGTDHLQLAGTLARSLAGHGIDLHAVHVVDRIAVGGRWHCVDGCGDGGVIEDPGASPLAAAAVLDGRRLYRRRTELQQVVATVDGGRRRRVAEAIEQHPTPGGGLTDQQARDAVHATMALAAQCAGGSEPGRSEPGDADLPAVACANAAPRVRDTLYALAVGDGAADAESLWVLLARVLPEPWRLEALTLLAFSAYARGDGPLAGIALEAALRCDPAHRMAGMLEQALQCGMRPEQIRELALSGYRMAGQLGVRLPPRRGFGQWVG
jgi:hypothetical protein